MISTLNVNALNALTKRHRLKGYKTRLLYKRLQETPFRSRETYRLKVRGWKAVFYANGNQKKSRVAILRQNTLKTVTIYKEGHSKMIKGSIQEEYTTVVNMHPTKKHLTNMNRHKRRNRQ